MSETPAVAPDTLLAAEPAASARPHGEPPGEKDGNPPAPPARALAAPPWVWALALAIPLTVVYLLAQPPSGDLAAATYRGEVFARAGFTLWDNGWYGGHYLPGYSVLAPALGALLGERLLLGLATLAAAGLFGVIAARVFTPGGARAAAVTFALGACVTMLSGRVAFTLGLVVGLGAVIALMHARTVAALALALVTALASPVAAAFLALVGVADALTGRPRRGLALAAAALVPIAAFAVAFPEGGYEPFAPSVFWPGVAGVVAIAVALPRLGGNRSRETRACGAGRFGDASGASVPRIGPRFGQHPRTARAVTVGAWLYAAALVAAYAVRTPVGSNAARLGELFAAPLVAGALWTRRGPKNEGPDRSRETLACGAGRFGDASGASVSLIGPRFGQPASGWLRHPRVLLLALAPVLLYWQLETPLNDYASLAGDPSVHAAYYAPLLRELERRADGAPVRVEVPMTGAHWESAYLPEHGPVLLARGWERQLDTRLGGLFYEGGPLAEGAPAGGAQGAAAAYRAWLYDNGVAYVALPDVRLDFAGAAEGRLIARGLPYLRPVWRGAHWRLYAVVGAGGRAGGRAPILPPPARLTAVGPDSFTLTAPRPGAYEVRVRYTPYWAVQRGRGCVRSAPGGWTLVDARAPGRLQVGIVFSWARVFAHGPRCS